MNEKAPSENSSLYLDYESYDFEVTPWEVLDPKTFATSKAPDNNKLSLFDKFINHKIKFYAYLNFFSKDPFISGIQVNFEAHYRNTLNTLTEKEIMENFTDNSRYEKEEQQFHSMLSGDTKESYLFFCKYYDTFFNKIGNGFFVNANGERLIEKETIRESGRTAKKITTWGRDQNNNITKALRAFPLLYRSPSNGGAFAVQYVCFIDGFIRNSIDYFDNGKILRLYLPFFAQHEMAIETITKVYKSPTFTANADALLSFLKNNQVSLHFNPDIKPFETNLKLETVGTNKNLRGCSIY